MVNQYPNKDMILKGSGASGGGAGASKGAAGGKKEISRAQFDGMDMASRASAMKEGAVVTD